MATTDKAEWVLLATDLTTRLAILPVEKSHLYMELSEPGSGELSIPMDSVAAGLVTSGMFCQCSYRGSDRGGFFVDNIGETHADMSEGGGRWMSLSGRGAMALLEDAIIWDDGTPSTVREFTSKTKAYILKTLIDEAQARSGLAVLTYDFDATTDSSSVAWTDSETYRLNVGMSLFDLVRQFSKSGIDFDIVLSGGSFVLSAYKNGKGTDKSETIYMRIGANCEEVSTDERGDKIKNVLRTAYKNGYLTVSDAVSIAALRRRERLLDIKQAQTTASASTYAAAILENSKAPQKSIKVKVYDGVSPRLFEDYGMGDYVMLDKMGTEIKYRVLGIQADFDGINYSDVILEMNSLLYENELRIANDLNWLMNQWATAEDGNLTAVSYWAALGNPDDAITEIRALHFSGTKLYVGGIFTRIGGINFTASQIAVYDTANGQWSKLADAPNLLQVYSILASGTDIYVGGFNGVEKYDTLTDTWSTLAGGVTTSVGGTFPVVNAMALIGTDLYVTGYFDGADGTPVAGLAVYDTVLGAWADVGGGITVGGGATAGSGKALAVIGSILYIGGDIDEVGGALAVANVCSWNTGTSTFDALDGGLDNTIFSLAVYGTNILAGGLQTDKLSEWDGAAWATFGGGVDGAVRGIAVYLTDVYPVGLFTDVGNRIARYNAGGWTKLGEALNNSAYAVANQNDDIYVGGIFTDADGKPVPKLAVYFSNFQSLLDYLANHNSGFDMGAAIHNAPASAITDSDEIPFWEDVSNALRKITWANIKATLFPSTGAERLLIAAPTTGLPTTHANFYYDNTNGIIYLGGSGGMPDGAPVTYALLNLIAPADDVPIAQTLWSFGATSTSSPVIAGYRSRGTKATPTAISSGDRLINIAGYGHDGAAWVGSAARILLKATENWAAGAHGAGIYLEGTPAASTTREQFAEITEAGVNIPAGRGYLVGGVPVAGGGDIYGTGVVGQVAEFVTNTKTLQAAKLIGPAVNILTITNTAAATLGLAITAGKTLTLTATDDFNLTIPATGTVALLGTVNQFTANQVITATLSTPASTAYGLDLEITHAAGATNVSAGQRGLFLTTTLTGSGGATSGYAGAVINALSSNTGTIATLFGTSSLARSNATSGNVTLAVAVRGQIATLDNGTMTEGDAFAAVSPTKVGTITTTVGYHAYNQGLAGATTSYAMLIEAQSGSTTNYAIYANAGLNYFAGNTGIGVTGPTTTDVLSVTGTITASTGTLSGVFIYPNYWPSANSSATQYGVRCIAQGNGIKSMTNLYGGEFRAVNNISAANGLVVGGYFLVVNNSASTITTANAGSFSMTSVNASSVITTGNMAKLNSPTMTAGSITTMNGLLIQNMGATGITNAYGIYIDAQSGAATLNYSIYTNAGDIVFNGGGAAQADFTWKTDTYDGVFGDASNDSIVIMSNAAGKIGFWGHAAAAQPAAYTITNDSADRALDCNSTSLDELADVVGTLVKDLQSIGLVG